jgi:hypothetical protein
LDEAGEALCQGNLREFWPAQRLATRLADELIARGQRHAATGDTSAGWRDLEMAERVGASAATVAGLRDALLARLLDEVEGYLAAGEPDAALVRLADLEKRKMRNRPVREARQVAERMIVARASARRGRFAQAADELASAVALRPQLASLAAWRDEFRRKGEEHRPLVHLLHEQLAARDWSRVLDTANLVLELAPDDGPARDARRRAWAAVGTDLAESMVRPAAGRRPVVELVENRVMNGSPDRLRENPDDDRAELARRLEDSAATLASAEPTGPRFLLWVDAVGGYLVCQGYEISLGQPVPGSYVDVPILGDLSRLHAKIRRDGEGYLLEPVRPTRLNGQLLTRTAPLADGSQIELGTAVKLVFRRPHPLSATARLDLVSRHRTQPAVDGVILMADSCVLGPGANAHVRCDDWTEEVVLAGRGDELVCRAQGHFTIDGADVENRGKLKPTAHVAGTDFSLSLERI